MKKFLLVFVFLSVGVLQGVNPQEKWEALVLPVTASTAFIVAAAKTVQIGIVSKVFPEKYGTKQLMLWALITYALSLTVSTDELTPEQTEIVTNISIPLGVAVYAKLLYDECS